MSQKKKRPPGRPRVDSIGLTVRLRRAEVRGIDNFVRQNKEEELNRPKAVRKILCEALGVPFV